MGLASLRIKMKYWSSLKKGMVSGQWLANTQPKAVAVKESKTVNITEKNGPLAGLLTVKGDEDLMIITDTGVMIRTSVGNISQTGRSTRGVKVMRLDQDAKIVTFTTVQPEMKR